MTGSRNECVSVCCAGDWRDSQVVSAELSTQRTLRSALVNAMQETRRFWMLHIRPTPAKGRVDDVRLAPATTPDRTRTSEALPLAIPQVRKRSACRGVTQILEHLARDYCQNGLRCLCSMGRTRSFHILLCIAPERVNSRQNAGGSALNPQPVRHWIAAHERHSFARWSTLYRQ